MPPLMMYDQVTIDDGARCRILDGSGYMVAQPRVARTGVQVYHGSEVDRPDMEFVRVYRPADEVFHRDSLATYPHKPLTLDHPSVLVNADNWKQFSIGHTGEEVVRDGSFVRIPMLMADAGAVKAYKDGTKQLSLGYTCDLAWTPGETKDGEKYDAIQTKIRANHLAVVGNARGGSQLSLDADSQNGDDAMNAPNMKMITVDGISLQMPDTAAEVVLRTIGRQQETIDAFKKKEKDDDDEDEKEKSATDAAMTKLKTDAAAAAAQIVTLTQQLKDATLTPEKIDALVRDRAVTVTKAKAVLGDKIKIEGTTDADIRKQVVSAKMGDLAKAWNDAEIKAAFDTLTATVDGRGGTVNDAALAFSRPGNHRVADVQTIRDQAHGEYVTNLEDAWKHPNGRPEAKTA